ncbi:hypothetical protein GGI42DRAFT_93569 [Trichoderma sp. SZMC 28013]
MGREWLILSPRCEPGSLAPLFRSLTKHAFSGGIFCFFCFLLVCCLFLFFFRLYSRDGTTGAKLLGHISCNWAELHQPLSCKRRSFLFYFWARDNGTKHCKIGSAKQRKMSSWQLTPRYHGMTTKKTGSVTKRTATFCRITA